MKKVLMLFNFLLIYSDVESNEFFLLSCLKFFKWLMNFRSIDL